MKSSDTKESSVIEGHHPVWNPMIQGPAKIILDTDISLDCDDVGAIALLHGLQTMGEAEILGMVSNTTNDWGAPCLDALNTWYGRPEIPVGTLKGRGSSGDHNKDWPGLVYSKPIAETYPHKLQSGQDAPSAVDLYRRLLSNAPNHSITIVSIGMLTNLRDLLLSRPDSISDKWGKELIREKVRMVSIMAAQYPKGVPDCNIRWDLPAAMAVVDEWPGPMMFNGMELGYRVLTGKRLCQEAPENNPARRAYHLHGDVHGPKWDNKYRAGDAINHASFDQISVLYAVRGLGEYWTAVAGGNFYIYNDARTEWRPGDRPDRACLIEKMLPEKLAVEIEDIMLLPPKA